MAWNYFKYKVLLKPIAGYWNLSFLTIQTILWFYFILKYLLVPHIPYVAELCYLAWIVQIKFCILAITLLHLH